MYENVGKKIKVLAQVCGWIYLIAGIITALVFLTNGYDSYRYGYHYDTDDDFIGWIALVTGIVGFISSWVLYGFGQLVDDVNAMRNGAEKPAVAAPSEELPEL